MNRVVLLVLIGILLLSFLGGFLWLDHHTKENIRLGTEEAIYIANSMSHVGQMPWKSSEYRLIAVVFCGEHKFFVESQGKAFGKEIFGCQYITAQDITIIPTGDTWSTDAKIFFRTKE